MPDLRDTIGGAVLMAAGLACLAVAFVAIVYLVMVGPDCADPWTGCETTLGMVG